MIKAVIFDMYETLITLFNSPLYFGKQIAEDLGIDGEVFLKDWDNMEVERSIGKLSLEQALKLIMHRNHIYSNERLNEVVAKRVEAKRECFRHLHPEIIPMLTELKKQELKVGLISNCFSEEAMVIRESILFPFFDAVHMSYEQRIQKPDKEIFLRCLVELGVCPQECLYIGDGGSNELEAAEAIGLRALQATWYLKEGTTQPVGMKDNYVNLVTPYEVLDYL